MSQTEKEVIDDLKTLLEGCKMGTATFFDYLNQVQDETLRNTLTTSISIFQDHETELKHHLETLDSNSQLDEIKIGSLISTFFEKIKAELATSDQQLLDYALRAVDMGIKGVRGFKERHHDLHPDLLSSIEKLEKDYKDIYQDLVDLKLDEQ